LREERVMSVCTSPGDVYAIVGHLDALGYYGCGYVGSAVKFLLSGGMNARWAGACVSEPAIGKRRVQGRDLESLWVRSDHGRRNLERRGAMGIPMTC